MVFGLAFRAEEAVSNRRFGIAIAASLTLAVSFSARAGVSFLTTTAGAPQPSAPPVLVFPRPER
jgi:hypothetical protein